MAVTNHHIVGAIEGAACAPLAVATFSDANVAASAGDFSVTIDWGDGTTSNNPTIQSLGGGAFNVVAGHTYSHAGDHVVVVTINGNGGGSANDTLTSTIGNAAMSAHAVFVHAVEGVNTGSV